MRIILGGLFIIAAILIFIVGDVFLLISAIIDIIQNIETITFWGLVKDVFLIMFRVLIAGIIALFLGFIGVLIMKD